MPYLAVTAPRSVVFDLTLIVHVGVVVASLVVFATMYGAAMSLAKTKEGGAWPVAARRYFASPGELAGRMIYLIPITGFLLLAISQRHFGFDDPFVGIGLAIWILAALVAEGLVFPSADALGRSLREQDVTEALVAVKRTAERLRWGVDAVVLLLIIGAVLMVAQP